MDAAAVTALCQCMGELTHRLALGAGAEALFWPDGQLRLEDLDVTVRGREAIGALFGDRDHPYFAPGNLHLLHSAAYDAPDGGEAARGHWNTYSLLRDGDRVRWGFLRLTADCTRRAGEWRLQRLHCLSLMTLEPWACVPGTGEAPEAPRGEAVDPADFLALRNLAGRFVQNGPLRARALFAGTAEDALDLPQVPGCSARGAEAVRRALEGWEETERANGMYLTHMTVQSPVFRLTGADRAAGAALSLIHSFRARAFGVEAPPYGLTRQVGRLDFTFRRREGTWRLETVRLTPLLTLEEEAYTPDPAHRQLMTEGENRVYAPPELAPPDPGEAFRVESIMAGWTEGVKRPDHVRFAQTYMDTRRVDPSMHFSFDYIGYEAVEARCRDMIARFAQKAPSLWRYPQFHSANTPVIEIAPGAEKATASWFDYGWGNIGVAVFYDEEETRRQYFPGAGKYYHSLLKEDGRWKIYRFFWRPTMQSLPAWDFDTRRVGGWAARGGGLWPLPLEDYALPADETGEKTK